MNNKRNKKGFTLVELIVVLIIIAILAVLLIPTLTGYIDKAKEKDVIAKTRKVTQFVYQEKGKYCEYNIIYTNLYKVTSTKPKLNN